MSRVVVIGATGHVGTYLVPRLVRAGHEVVALSRGEREPYLPAPEWRGRRAGRRSTARPRTRRARSASGSPRSAPDAVDRHDLLHARVGPAAGRRAAPERGRCWCTAARSGSTARPRACRSPRTSRAPPTASTAPARRRSRRCCTARRSPAACRASCCIPGHISGPAGRSITPAGNLDPDVWRRLATGEPLAAARPRARRAAPRARRRRRAGVRARAHPPRRDRLELPRRRPSRR